MNLKRLLTIITMAVGLTMGTRAAKAEIEEGCRFPSKYGSRLEQKLTINDDVGFSTRLDYVNLLNQQMYMTLMSTTLNGDFSQLNLGLGYVHSFQVSDKVNLSIRPMVETSFPSDFSGAELAPGLYLTGSYGDFEIDPRIQFITTIDKKSLEFTELQYGCTLGFHASPRATFGIDFSAGYNFKEEKQEEIDARGIIRRKLRDDPFEWIEVTVGSGEVQLQYTTHF